MDVAVQTRWHQAACIFPMLPDSELQELANDIRKHGLRDPVVLFQGLVLDGRNRWAACEIAGVKPKTRDFTGSPQDALAFVWSSNVHRRHLNSSQAAIALAKREILDTQYRKVVEAAREMAAKREDVGKPKPQLAAPSVQRIEPTKDNSKLIDHKLAESAGTNRTYINQSRKIVEQAPQLAAKIERGEMTIPQASTEMRREEKRKELSTKTEEVKKAFSAAPLWTLINQDVMDGLQSVIDHHGPARLIFTDPPYNIGIEYGDHHNDKMDSDRFVEWCLEWMQRCCQCLTDDGSLWVMINDEYAADFVMNMRDCGLTMRSWIKWYETFGVNCSNNFNRTSRHILYFVMDEDNFVFNETEALRPSDRQTKYGDSRAQSSGKIMDDVWQIPRVTGTSKERIPDFPTQLPLELVTRIVRIASEPGDLVIDPFNGSGTTGEAAVRGNRKYIGIDASEKFINLAEKRLAGAQYDV